MESRWSAYVTSSYEVPFFVGNHNVILTEIREVLQSQYCDAIFTGILFKPFVGSLSESSICTGSPERAMQAFGFYKQVENLYSFMACKNMSRRKSNMVPWSGL